MSDPDLLTESGLIGFDSMNALRRYMSELLKHYERRVDTCGERVGRLMRDRQRAESGSHNSRIIQQNWAKIGLMYVSTRDPKSGMLEVLLEALEDYKAKAARTEELLRSFEKLEDLNIAKGSSLTLFVKNGIPFRLIVDPSGNVYEDESQLTIPA